MTDIPTRLKILRFMVAGNNQTAFAVRMGFGVKNWNNFERGHGLSKEAAIQLVQKVPGLTLDWLYLGKLDGLPLRLRDDLEEAAAALNDLARARG